MKIKDFFDVPKKIRTGVVLSWILNVWGLLAIWQFGGMKLYALLLMILLSIISHIAMVGIFAKENIKKKLILLLIACNVFLFMLGMLFSAVFEEDSSKRFMQLEESKGMAYLGITEDQRNDLAKNIPIVSLENGTNGIVLQWNKIDSVDGYAIFRRDSAGYQNIATILDNNVTTYTDVSALPAKKYMYTVCVLSDKAADQFVTSELVAGVWKPTIEVLNQTETAMVKWTGIEGAEKYKLYRKQDDGKYECIFETDNTTFEYSDHQIEYGVKYTYGVRAYIGEEYSVLATASITFTLPNAIVNAQCVNEGVKVNWEPISLAEMYYIYRKEKDGKYSKIKEVDATVTEYFDDQALSETEYYYAVRAKKGKYLNAYEAVNVVTGKFPEKEKEKEKEFLNSLERISVELSQKGNTVHLSWNKTEGVAGYHVYRKDKKQDDYVMIAVIDTADMTTYSDDNLQTGEQYLYYVCAFVGENEGAYAGAMIEVK